MDHGTDAIDILYGRVVPIKLGIIGCVNRSQAAINRGQSIADALADERTFFQKNYPMIAARNGTKFLTRKLNTLLLSHIRNCLPHLKSRVNMTIAHYHHTLASYGEPVLDTGATLLSLLTKFTRTYGHTVEGTAQNIAVAELCGGARICYIFHDIFGKTLQNMDALQGLSTKDILTAIRNATGPRPSLFVPEISFELLVKRQIKKLEEPALRCVEMVYEELHRIVKHSLNQIPDVRRFPHLQDRIADVVASLLQAQLEPTNRMVQNIVKIELSYVNTSHPDFTGGASTVVSSIVASNNATRRRLIAPTSPSDESDDASDTSTGETTSSATRRPSSWLKGFMTKTEDSDALDLNQPRNRELSEREERDSEIVQRLIRSYFNIVRKNVQDAVPKAVMCFLVNHVCTGLQSELVSRLYRPELFDSLLEEAEQMAVRRKEAGHMLAALQRAAQLVSDIRDTHVTW